MDKLFIEGFIRRLTPDEAVLAAGIIHDAFGISHDQSAFIKELEKELEASREEVSDLETTLESEKEDAKERYTSLEIAMEELKNDSPDALLREMAEKYRLSDSQYYQDELIKILENEYNLVLIVAPAKNN